LKILVLITNNKGITDNIGLLKSDNLETVILKENEHIIYYLEEYIPDFIIFDSNERINDLEYFLKKNPHIRIFISSDKCFFKEHKNTIKIENISNIESIRKIIETINSIDNGNADNKKYKISENLKVINQQVISFLSIKGGAGNTTSALNSAVIANEEYNLKTAFIDISFSEAFSDLSSYLGIGNMPNLDYYFLNYKEGKDALRHSVSFKSGKGLDIYLSPMTSKSINKLDSDIFASFLYQLRSYYNLIIFDYPLNLFSVNSFFEGITDFTTFFIVTSFPTPLCARKTYEINKLIADETKILNILNNTSIPVTIKKEEYEKISGSKVISEIPQLDLKLHTKLKINNLETEVIDIRKYLSCFFNNYLMA
jgi:MinD-like ATPase involved in chromosome partitioning or flagellar assembly